MHMKQALCRSRAAALALVLILPFVFSGCVTTGSQLVKLGQDELQSSAQPVTGYGGLKFDVIQMAEPLRFAMDKNLPYITQDGRRKFVKGLRLPEISGPYSLKITSFRLGTPTDPAILYPDVRLLDAEFREVRAIAPASYLFRAMPTGEGLTATMFINNRDKGERYVVISERNINERELESTQQNITTTVPVTVYTGAAVITWMVPTGVSSPPVRMIASPVGQIEFAVDAYRPLKIGE